MVQYDPKYSFTGDVAAALCQLDKAAASMPSDSDFLRSLSFVQRWPESNQHLLGHNTFSNNHMHFVPAKVTYPDSAHASDFPVMVAYGKHIWKSGKVAIAPSAQYMNLLRLMGKFEDTPDAREDILVIPAEIACNERYRQYMDIIENVFNVVYDIRRDHQASYAGSVYNRDWFTYNGTLPDELFDFWLARQYTRALEPAVPKPFVSNMRISWCYSVDEEKANDIFSAICDTVFIGMIEPRLPIRELNRLSYGTKAIMRTMKEDSVIQPANDYQAEALFYLEKLRQLSLIVGHAVEQENANKQHGVLSFLSVRTREDAFIDIMKAKKEVAYELKKFMSNRGIDVMLSACLDGVPISDIHA